MHIDVEFLKKLRKRDEETYQDIIDKYSRLLWMVCSQILSPSEQDIEECVSDVFIDLWNKPKKFDPRRGTLKTYLVIKARSQALNIRKKRTREAFLNIEDYHETVEDYMDQTFDNVFNKDGYDLLYQAIAQLKYPTDEIIIRRYFYNEKPKIIAEKLSISVKEVENRLYRGKKTLLDLLSDYKEEFFNEL